MIFQLHILMFVFELYSVLACVFAKEWKTKSNFSQHTSLFSYISLYFWMSRQRDTFFCHRTVLTLPSINNEIAFTGKSFLHNGYPVLSIAVETKRVSFPSQDNHRLHPPLDFAAETSLTSCCCEYLNLS